MTSERVVLHLLYGTATRDDIVQNGDAKDDQPMEVNGDPTADPDQSKELSTANEQASRKKTKILNVVNPNLPVKHNVSSMNSDTINEFKAIESTFQASVLFEKEKADSKNALEEYMFDFRRQLDEELSPFIKESDAEKLKSTLYRLILTKWVR